MDLDSLDVRFVPPQVRVGEPAAARLASRNGPLPPGPLGWRLHQGGRPVGDSLAAGQPIEVVPERPGSFAYHVTLPGNGRPRDVVACRVLVVGEDLDREIDYFVRRPSHAWFDDLLRRHPRRALDERLSDCLRRHGQHAEAGRQAFGWLVELQRPRLRNLFGPAGMNLDWETLAQDAAVRQWRALDRFVDDELRRPFGPVFVQTARRLAVDYLRRGRSRKGAPMDWHEVPDDEADDGGEAMEAVNHWLGLLPRELREVLWRRLLDHSYIDIADELGIKPGQCYGTRVSEVYRLCQKALETVRRLAEADRDGDHAENLP